MITTLPTLTLLPASMRSRPSGRSGPLPFAMPSSSAVGTDTPTANVGSVTRRITDRWLVTRTTLPTSPAPVTTGMPSLMPAPTPRSISIVASKFDGAPDTTRAATVGTLPK